MLDAVMLECTRGERVLFHDLSLRVEPGTLLRVGGVNGSGKSSFLRILCGLLKPTLGEVRWRGESIHELGEDFHRELLYVGHRNGVKDDLTVIENLRAWMAMAGRSSDVAIINAALSAVGLEEYGSALARYLSQGQCRRIALARLFLAGETPLWILDEPFTALDANAVESLSRHIAAQIEGGGMVVLTTHQDVRISAPVVQTLNLGKADDSGDIGLC
jgi:heme exporter protein A